LTDAKPHDVIQIKPPHRWGGCFATVSIVRTWGVQAFVAIPNSVEPPGRAFIRLAWSEFEPLGVVAPFVLGET